MRGLVGRGSFGRRRRREAGAGLGQGGGQAGILHRLQQVVEGIHGEGLQGVFVVGGGEDDVRGRFQRGQQLEAGLAGHLHVEQQHVGPQGGQLGAGFIGVAGLPHHRHVGKSLEQVAQLGARQPRVVNDEHVH